VVFFTLLSTFVLAFSLSLGLLLALMLTDAYVMFSQVALAAMFLGWLAITLALAGLCSAAWPGANGVWSDAVESSGSFPSWGAT